MTAPEKDGRVTVAPFSILDALSGKGKPPRNGHDAAAAEILGRPGVATQAKRFDLIPFSAISFSDGPRWLVRGLMAAQGLVTIFGPPKQYKSFIAADLGLHIASGRAWAGRKVRQGTVVYIVGEGQTGFSDRIAANRHERGYPDDLPFFLVKARPNLGTGEGDTAALIAAIEPVVAQLQIPLVAVFVDTLVRTLAGADENDVGMRNFTDNAENIANRFDCATIAVHHTGKDVARGMRGSSALHGAVVTSWRVEKAQSFQARITLEDAKDGEVGLSWTAELERFVFRTDADGNAESVLLVREVSEPIVEAEKTTSAAKPAASIPKQLTLFLACLDEAMGTAGRNAMPFPNGPLIKVVPLSAVRDEYMRRRGDDASDDAKRKSFTNSQKSGVERQLIAMKEMGGDAVIWRP